jgi:hypothetical protein
MWYLPSLYCRKEEINLGKSPDFAKAKSGLFAFISV